MFSLKPLVGAIPVFSCMLPKGTGPGVYTVTDPPKGTGPSVYTVTDPFGTGAVPKTGPAFLEADRERIEGTVSRSRVNKRPIRHDFWIGTIWNRSRVNIASVTVSITAKGSYKRKLKIQTQGTRYTLYLPDKTYFFCLVLNKM